MFHTTRLYSRALSRTHVHQLISLNINRTPWISSQHQLFCNNTQSDNIPQETSPISKYQSKVAILSHPSCAFHEDPDHPESPQRLKAVMDGLNNPEIMSNGEDDFTPNLQWFDDPPQVTRSRITMAHSQTHVDDILDKAEDASEQNKVIRLDPDTFISPHSEQSIMCSPALVSYAVDIVLRKENDTDIKRTFCAVRPPGHHAEYDRAMGFCIFNNVFIGAKYAQFVFADLYDNHNAKIAIIDFDVHHGNGTQALSWNEQNILYISLHQYDKDGRFYPGTGGVEECGAFDNVLNVPFEEESDGADIKNAFSEKIIPKLDTFAPDLIMISAGFDGHKDDGIANLNYVEEDFEWMTEQIVNAANTHCEGKVVSVLEGGYNVDALKNCVTAHVKALCV